MAVKAKETILTGWGRMAPADVLLYRPEKRRALNELLQEGAAAHLIPRGLGRSYGDTAVNSGGGVIDMTRLNRMLSFDAEKGVLTCEAGVSLAEVLEVFAPRGWFPTVTPGTRYVTIGGAIANDVHGKNHHQEGAFARYVPSLQLLTPAGELINCGPNENSDVFWATAGGIGLTGIILTAQVQLQRIDTAYIRMDRQRARNFEEAVALMTADDDHYQYSVAWIDCLAEGEALGRAVLLRGNHAPVDALPANKRRTPLALPKRRRFAVPFDMPSATLHPKVVRTFNQWYYGRQHDALDMIVDYESYFYPLDSINDWNRLYGKRGFAQFQATIPERNVRGLQLLLEALSESRRASFLAVLKRFGSREQGLLSYPTPGYTLALDLPNRDNLPEFLRRLERIVLEHEGRLYFAKDVAASPESIAAMYPKLPQFQDIKHRLDPDQRLQSDMSRRLHITTGPRPHQELLDA